MVDDENLLNRIDNIMVETGIYLPMDTDVRTIMYLSNQVENRKQRRIAAQQQAAAQRSSPRR